MPSETVAPVPSPPSPATTPVPTTEAAFPPSPTCPAPERGPGQPVVTAAAGGGAPVPARLGSYTIATCSSVLSADSVAGDPDTPIVVAPSDQLLVEVAAPWRVAQWQGSDVPVRGDAANVWPPVALAERPRSFTMGIPPRTGRSILTLELLLASDDGRAVGTFPASFLVHVEP